MDCVTPGAQKNPMMQIESCEPASISFKRRFQAFVPAPNITQKWKCRFSSPDVAYLGWNEPLNIRQLYSLCDGAPKDVIKDQVLFLNFDLKVAYLV